LQRTQERAAAAGKLERVMFAKDVAERANTAKTHFLAVLSHELRAPLASIANAAELIGRHAATPDKLSGLASMIKRNAAIEARLIDDLLDLSAISAGKLNLSMETVDIDALVQQVVEMLQHDIVSKDLQLTVEQREPGMSLAADPVRIQQVFWNILRNAVKFTPRGGQIRLVTEVRGDDFVFTCTDSGIGIGADALSRIFLPYEQASDDTFKRVEGLGLGLAIAEAIVSGHGGRLEAASAGRNHGAVFTLRLPINAKVASPSELNSTMAVGSA